MAVVICNISIDAIYSGNYVGEHLDSDLAPKLGVPGAVDLTHPACSNEGEDLVLGELAVGGECHLAALFNGATLFVISIGISYEAYERLLEPVPRLPPDPYWSSPSLRAVLFVVLIAVSNLGSPGREIPQELPHSVLNFPRGANRIASGQRRTERKERGASTRILKAEHVKDEKKWVHLPRKVEIA